MYDLLDSDAIGNDVGGISTSFKHCSGHMLCSGSFDLMNRSLKLFRLVSLTFRLSPSTSCPANLVVLSSDHQPIRNQQPRTALRIDMSVWACHVDGYGLTCQPITSVTLARLCLVW
ncbi:hypothetical protein AMTRI_Chr11g97870 [Amborella trichopoda]